MLTAIELFAGVGGFRLGLEKQKNIKVIWSNQFEPSTKIQHASLIYETKFGKEGHINKDINLVESDDIPIADICVGGFPCQNYSVATPLKHSKGIFGDKGVLWWQIERILRTKNEINQPYKYLLFENVDRILLSPTKQQGRDFALILSSLNNLDYVVEWHVINAADYGMPQKRKRTSTYSRRFARIYS